LKLRGVRVAGVVPPYFEGTGGSRTRRRTDRLHSKLKPLRFGLYRDRELKDLFLSFLPFDELFDIFHAERVNAQPSWICQNLPLEPSVKNLTSCPVCDSTQLSWAFSAPTTRGQDQRRWSVFKCNVCTHQFMNPQPSWKDLEFYYNKAYYPYDPMHGSQATDDHEIEQAKRTGVFATFRCRRTSGCWTWGVARDGSCVFRRS
jgi:hypothetical protein